jgi:YggT family protein
VYGWAGLVNFFLFNVLSPILGIYFWIVIISAVLTWFSPDPYNPLVRAIYGMTEPVFDWIREHLPVLLGGIDLSPIVVIVVIEFLQLWVLPNLYNVLVYGFA